MYNESGSKAIYPLLCFMHEDILIETKDWGELIGKHLERKETGMIGVAGGDAIILLMALEPVSRVFRMWIFVVHGQGSAGRMLVGESIRGRRSS